MKVDVLCIFAALSAISAAQQPVAHPSKPAVASPALQKHTNELGFSYSLPADWQMVDMSGALHDQQQKAQTSEASDEEKHGVGCIQIAITAHHGDRASMITAVDLPTACMGTEMSQDDLAGFGRGAAEGIRQNFDLGEAVESSYMLGRHHVWIARAPATPIGSAGPVFTVETVCTLVQKGAVCWMILAADEAALTTFERGPVVLDSDPPSPLVPKSIFTRKPSVPAGAAK
jgi:hypothetical protein